MADHKPPALFFHADAIESSGKDLVGRRAAGQSFLRAWLDYTPGERVHALVQTEAAAKTFETTAQALGCKRDLSIAVLRGAKGLSGIGSAFFPGPGYLNAAWIRQKMGTASMSLVGITHTMSTRRVIEGVHNLMHEPVEPWDAVICTSHAVKSVLDRQLEQEAAFTRARYGATRVPQPQTPVIPLGIHADDFTQQPGDRTVMRNRFNVPAGATVVMTMGRLTSVEKANPAPLFIALEQVAQRSGKPVHLWMVGWSSRDDEVRLHTSGAKALAPSVKVTLIDGRKPDLRRHIWAGADIFTLPVDNIQETFGLVPVEAMAAGLPVVMPDWNGFRDTVVHGETGFLIPTRFNDAGTKGGARVADRFADGTDDYLRYLSLLQHQTAIDIPAYRDAFLRLIADDDLRRKMGAQGQAHVRAHLDWSAVMPQYMALHDRLAADRANAPDIARKPAMNPTVTDPFDAYAGYPSTRLDGRDVLVLRAPLDEATLAAMDAVNGRTLYNRRIVPNTSMLACVALIATDVPMTLDALIDASVLPPEAVRAVVLFLLKYDFLTITPYGSK